jgi:hypothetical protein
VLKQWVRKLGRTGVGKNLIHAAVLPDPAEMRFANVDRWPESVRGSRISPFSSRRTS